MDSSFSTVDENRPRPVDLSIFIPSYNRPEKLLNTLRAFLPQITDGVIVTVLDNCSVIPCEQYCISDAAVKLAIDRKSIRFVRHRWNVGMSANFMRAFEICETEWMWLVSDDDHILPDAVVTIVRALGTICSEEKISFVKFSSQGCEVPQPIVMRSLDELIDALAISMVHFNSYIFISNGVYRVPSFGAEIEVGYQFLHTYVPHLMMMLYHLYRRGSDVAFLLSEKKIASYVRPEVGYSYGFVAGLGVGAFKNLPFNISKRQYRRLDSVFAAHNDFKVVIDLFYFSLHKGNMYVARQLASNYYLQIRSARSRLHCCALRVFILFLYAPSVFMSLVELSPYVAPSLGRHVVEMKNKYRR